MISQSSEKSASSVATELSHALGLPADELIYRGLLFFIEKEIRLAETDIADLKVCLCTLD